ncbi:MAG: hypothetical protein AAGA68_15730 [Pseudomonadota bacterium]
MAAPRARQLVAPHYPVSALIWAAVPTDDPWTDLLAGAHAPFELDLMGSTVSDALRRWFCAIKVRVPLPSTLSLSSETVTCFSAPQPAAGGL